MVNAEAARQLAREFNDTLEAGSVARLSKLLDDLAGNLEAALAAWQQTKGLATRLTAFGIAWDWEKLSQLLKDPEKKIEELSYMNVEQLAAQPASVLSSSDENRQRIREHLDKCWEGWQKQQARPLASLIELAKRVPELGSLQADLGRAQKQGQRLRPDGDDALEAVKNWQQQLEKIKLRAAEKIEPSLQVFLLQSLEGETSLDSINEQQFADLKRRGLTPYLVVKFAAAPASPQPQPALPITTPAVPAAPTAPAPLSREENEF